MSRVRIRFDWTGETERLHELLTPLADEVRATKQEELDIDVQTGDVVITAEYASINAVREICKVWIDLWGGDEWGESMDALYQASHTSYGLSDGDCARVTRILWKNLQSQKEWMDDEGHEYFDFSDEDMERVYEETRRMRDYWRNGGNLGPGPDADIGTATIASMPRWLFGEE